MEDYLEGLLMPIERKNCEQMAAAIPGCHAQRLHNLLTTATRGQKAVNDKRIDLFLEQFGRDPGYLVFDDTRISKKGKGSVGVARQNSGTLGKIGDYQVSSLVNLSPRKEKAVRSMPSCICQLSGRKILPGAVGYMSR